MIVPTASTKFVIAPSPLEGEGSVIWQQRELGEEVSASKASCEATPSPEFVMLLHLHALFHEGKRCNNGRPSLGVIT